MTKQNWERLIAKQDRLIRELETGFELNESKLFREILLIEGQLVLMEN